MALFGDLRDPNADDPAVPDWLVTTRQFVGTLNSALNDQSYAGTDGSVYRPTGGFVTVGPQGASVEGRPITLTRAGGVQLSAPMVWLLLGAGAFWVFSKKG
jgi:hypothetical protein